MAPGKRSFHGKKRKFDERNAPRQSKPKKDQFDYRNASYVKERQVKTDEIEARRQILEAEKMRQRLQDTDSSEDEELNPQLTLMKAFPDYEQVVGNIWKPIITSSESENEQFDPQDKNQTNEEQINESEMDDEDSENCMEDDRTTISMKEDFEDDETAQEDAGHLRDPFSLHLRNDMDDELYKAVSATPQTTEVTKMSWPILGNMLCEIPKPIVNPNDKITKVKKPLDDEEKQYTNFGKPPRIIKTVDWNKIYVKEQLHENLTKANYNNIKDNIEENSGPLTRLQKELFSVINNYQDLLYPKRTFENADQIRFIYCLHALNHVLKTRTKILHHNTKLAKSNRGGMGETPDKYKDQGLVRPKVLIIVPFKHSCLKIVEMFISILFGEDKGGSVINKLRFMEDFTGNELMIGKKNPKPKDYELIMQGNIDDKFKIGMAITKKSFKLYTNFYSSDIIIGSPLGLRRVVGADGEAVRDYDFLSSIELLIMDQIDVVLMQNWDHLYQILDYMHLQPRKTHDIDYSRLRSWCVNGRTKYYRQTLIFSSMELAHVNTLLIRKCFNYAGKVKVANAVMWGSIRDVTVTIPQLFHRFESIDLAQSIDNRLEFFLKEVLPMYADPIFNHTLIYIPSYFDFLYVRNRLLQLKYSFAQIHEYAPDSKVARARDMFFHGDAQFLLYTERWHFWRRTRIKGIRHIIFYQLPTYPHFYSEMCNLMDSRYQNPRSGTTFDMSVTVMYNKFDVISLAKIVGHGTAIRLLSSESKEYTFRR